MCKVPRNGICFATNAATIGGGLWITSKSARMDSGSHSSPGGTNTGGGEFYEQIVRENGGEVSQNM